MTVFGQDGYGLRLEWGSEGVAALGAACRVLVVIDVLSFSTRVDLLLARGEAVRPVRWSEASPPEDGAVALRSPNGATLSAEAAATGAQVLTACLRNAGAVAKAALTLADGAPIGVVPCGERWGVTLGAAPGATGPLRPCVEDHLGAGAVAAALLHLGAGRPSPETSLAALAYRAADVATLVAGCASGRELTTHGQGDIVWRAAEVGASTLAPILTEGRYRHG